MASVNGAREIHQWRVFGNQRNTSMVSVLRARGGRETPSAADHHLVRSVAFFIFFIFHVRLDILLEYEGVGSAAIGSRVIADLCPRIMMAFAAVSHRDVRQSVAVADPLGEKGVLPVSAVSLLAADQ